MINLTELSEQRAKFLYFPWVCRGMGWIYGWGLFLETNCQYPRLILHNILRINQDFRRGRNPLKAFLFGSTLLQITSIMYSIKTGQIFITIYFPSFYIWWITFPFPCYSCSTKFNLLFVGALLTRGCLTSKWKKNDCRGKSCPLGNLYF